MNPTNSTLHHARDVVSVNALRDVTLAEGGTYTFHLKANKNMKFTGVPVGTTITVKESAAKNYKGSAEITINGTIAEQQGCLS